MFSLYLGLQEHDSRVWFGGYDRSMIIAQADRDYPDGGHAGMTDAELDEKIEWFSLAYAAYWSTPLTKVSIGGEDIGIEVENMIFDSGSSLNHVPVSDFNRIIEIITKDRDC